MSAPGAGIAEGPTGRARDGGAGGAEAPQLDLESVTTPAGFLGLRDEWNAIAPFAQTVFLTHGWLSTWLDVYGNGTFALRVLTARAQGALVAALPLVLVDRGPFGRQLEFMGSGPLTPNRLDLVARPEFRSRSLDAFAGWLADRQPDWDVIDLCKLPKTSDTGAVLVQRLSVAGVSSTMSDCAVCPCVQLPASHEEFTASLPSGHRKSLRHRTTRLQRDHPDAHFHQVETEAEAQAALDALERMHQSRWQARGYAGSFADPRFGRFHRRFVAQALRDGVLRFHTLCADDTIIGATYNFRTGDCIQCYLTAFDPQWAQYSPGNRVHTRAAEAAIDEGVAWLDLLEGDEAYKGVWATSKREEVRLRVFNSTLRGRLARLQASSEAGVTNLSRHIVPEPARLAVRKRMGRMRALHARRAAGGLPGPTTD